MWSGFVFSGEGSNETTRMQTKTNNETDEASANELRSFVAVQT